MVKLKQLLTEKKELDGNVVKKIAKLTDFNNHNEARLVLAKEMGLKNLVKGYEAITVLHKMFNQMNEMMAARNKSIKNRSLKYVLSRMAYKIISDIKKYFWLIPFKGYVRNKDV